MNVYDYLIEFENHAVKINYSFRRVGISLPEGDFYQDKDFDFDIQEIINEDGENLTEAEFKKIEPNYLTIIQDNIEKP